MSEIKSGCAVRAMLHVTDAIIDSPVEIIVDLQNQLADKDAELTHLQEKVAQLEGDVVTWKDNYQTVLNEFIAKQAECERLQQQLVELDHCREEAGKAEDIAKECERLRVDAFAAIELAAEAMRLGDFGSEHVRLAENIVLTLSPPSIRDALAQLTKEQPT